MILIGIKLLIIKYSQIIFMLIGLKYFLMPSAKIEGKDHFEYF